MNRVLRIVAVALFSGALLSFQVLAAEEVRPGVERWPIKTSIPAKPAAKTLTFEQLVALVDPPDVAKNDKRYQSKLIPSFDNPLGVREGDMITMSAWLHLVAGETDGDYHIQVSSSQESGDKCIVIEVPMPEEKFVASESLRAQAEKVRAFIREKLLKGKEPSSTGSVMNHPVFVKITGQLFYDDAHVGEPPRGKKGMHAATLWELHPVTDVAFAPKPTS